MEYAMAIFDIGKTNKKLLVFSDDLAPIHVESIRIGEVEKNGVLCDDVEKLENWFSERLKRIAERYAIRGLNVSTHGATLAYLSRGSLAFPIISYNHDIEHEIRREFYDRFGSPLELYRITGTPPYGRLIIAGLQVYWFSRRFPEIFSRVDRILFFPQYLIYSISGLEANEITSIGCHTYLYDLRTMDWSIIARDLGVDALSPKLVNVWNPLGEFGLSGLRIVAAPGIHDSNASILPFMSERRNILLASTGTWCVFMHPRGGFNPKPEDLDRDVVYYVSPYGDPIRSSRFAGGYEHDYYAELIKERFRIDPRKMPLKIDALRKLIKYKRDFITPGLIEKTGQFQRSKPRIIGDAFYKDPALAYHLLNLDLAIQSYIAIRLIMNEGEPDIVVLGGFANNDIYLSILSTLFPENRVFRSTTPEITGLGAAICCKCAIEGLKPDEISIKPSLQEIPKLELDLDGLEEYVSLFTEFSSTSEDL